MTMRELLLRAYPRQWRDEYGEELAGILAQTRLTVGLVFDVLGAAAKQRLYRAEPWKICGACLILRVPLFKLLPVDRATTLWCWIVPTNVLLFGTGAWTVLRRNSGVWSAAAALAKAALAGAIPTVIFYVLMLFNVDAVTRHRIYYWMPKTVVASLASGVMIGLAGALAARGHAIFRRGLRRA
jgi:hypothetical protein